MPIAYVDTVHEIRYTRPGSRKQHTETVRSGVAVNVAEATAAEAETVAVLRYRPDEPVRYVRVDGRLYAPVRAYGRGESLQARTLHLLEREPRYSLLLGQHFHPKDWLTHGASGRSEVARREDVAVANLLSDDLEEKAAQSRAIGARLLDLDGDLYEETHPPAWTVTRQRDGTVLVIPSASAYPGTVPDADRSTPEGAQVFRADDLASAERFAPLMAAMTGSEVRRIGHGIEVMAPDAMAIDAAGASAAVAMREVCEAVGREGNKDILHRLDDRTIHAWLAVRRAVAASPVSADPVSARALVGEFLDAVLGETSDRREGMHYVLESLVRAARPFVLRFDACEAPRAEEEDLPHFAGI